MTNEIIAPAAAAAAPINGEPFVQVICDGGSIWSFLLPLLCFLLVVVAPSLCLITCIRARRRNKRGQSSPCSTRVILVSALLTLAATLVKVFADIGHALMIAGTARFSAGVRAMFLVDLSRECTLLALGVSACSFCILCLILLPARRYESEDANHAPLGTARRLAGRGR